MHRFPRIPRLGLVAAVLAAVATVPASATTGPTAEITSSNLFLGSTKVEVGSRANGSFGSSVAAPAGFSPRTNSGTILGFRVNETECDWTDPGCITLGDFFTPGSPYEAWGVQIGNGTPAYNSNAANGIAGAFASSDAATSSGVWQSSSDVGGAIRVRATYSLPQYGWLVNSVFELTNTSGATVNDVYVMRGLDPDNCRMESRVLCDSNGDGVADTAGTTGGVFDTHQRIVSQGTASTPALITATQTNGSYLGLRAEGDQARVFAQNSSFSNPADLQALWNGANGAYTDTVGHTSFGDNGIYTVVRVPSIAPGATATVRIQYVVKEIPGAADLSGSAVSGSSTLVDVLAANTPGSTLQGICTAPAHGTAVVEGGKVRYTPAAGFTGTDTFEYSTGGPCGRVTMTVTAAPAAEQPDAVAVPGAAPKLVAGKGGVRSTVTLTLPRAGRYTFIYLDAAARRVPMVTGSKVGVRTLRRQFSAPVLVTAQDSVTVKLAVTLLRKTPKGLKLRIVRRTPDGVLSDMLL